MKRILSCLLACSLLAGLMAGCGKTPAETSPPTVSAVTQETRQTAETTPPAPPAEPAPSPRLWEVMPDNRFLTLGHSLDWIELLNPEETAMSLDGCFLTDDPAVPQALPLAGNTIAPGGFLTVTLDARAPFQLSEAGETVYLTDGSRVLDSLTFPPVSPGVSYGPEGALPRPSPGYANTEEGQLAWMENQTLPDLVLSEAMPDNQDALRTDGEYYDWVEVENRSGASLSLLGYSLADRWADRERYDFPEVTLAPGQRFLVLCSGLPQLGDRHAPFGINPGETLYLSRMGTPTDALPLPADLKPDESYGRRGTVPMYFREATPGGENSDGFLTGVPVPEASVPSGLYREPVTLELSGEGTIYYTRSGSRPDRYSRVYTEPIVIRGTETIRTFCVRDGRASPCTAFTYVVGPGHDLPVVTVAIPDSSLYGGEGILSNVRASYEYEGVVTLIEDGEEKFSVPCGLKLHGNDSRLGAKKNFQLRFRGEYGAGKLNYPLFDTRNFDSFDSLLLKGGSEDWDIANMRDEIATNLVDGTTALYAQAMKPVVLYLGGEYWGVYYLRERFSEAYVASHMGVSPESADILYSSAGYVQCGSSDDFDRLKSFTKTHNMRLTENYRYLCRYIDMDSLMDWYICRTFVEDTDLANIRRCRSPEGDGKWHWMYFDLDWSFYTRGGNALDMLIHSFDGDRTLINAVLESEAGRDAFLQRYNHLLHTVLNDENIRRTVDGVVAQIASEMPRDRERWHRSVGYWEDNVDEIRNFDRDGRRTRAILNDIQDYFGLSNREMDHYFGDFRTESQETKRS